MALMFPRIAQNYAKKGFYTTDEATLERLLCFLQPKGDGHINVFDPCVGEGVALAEIQHHFEVLDCKVKSYGIEVDQMRSEKASAHINHVLRSDFFATVVEQQSFDVMLFNPPYGDILGDSLNMAAGEKRFEKAFFRRTVGLLKPGGVSVMILDYPQLDQNFAERIARNFADVSVYKAVDPTYKQVVIFGKKVKTQSPKANVVNLIKHIRDTIDDIPVIPECPEHVYEIRTTCQPLPVKKFRTINIDAKLCREEMAKHSNMLWDEFDVMFKSSHAAMPRPLIPMKDWHTALALISGCVNGIVHDDKGNTLYIKGACYKTIVKRSEKNTYENGDEPLTETLNIETEQYQAEIMAINFTQGDHYGDIIRIQ